MARVLSGQWDVAIYGSGRVVVSDHQWLCETRIDILYAHHKLYTVGVDGFSLNVVQGCLCHSYTSK